MSGRLIRTVLQEHSLRVRCVVCGEILEQMGLHDYSEDPRRVVWIVDVQPCPTCTTDNKEHP